MQLIDEILCGPGKPEHLNYTIVTMEDGTPLYQNVGNSYVNLAPLDSEILWE